MAAPSNVTEPGSVIEAGKVPETSVSRTFPETARTEKESIGLKVIKQVSAAGPAEHSGLTPPVNVPIRMPALVKRLKLSPVCTEPTTTSSISPRSTETKTLVFTLIAQFGSEQVAGRSEWAPRQRLQRNRSLIDSPSRTETRHREGGRERIVLEGRASSADIAGICAGMRACGSVPIRDQITEDDRGGYC